MGNDIAITRGLGGPVSVAYNSTIPAVPRRHSIWMGAPDTVTITGTTITGPRKRRDLLRLRSSNDNEQHNHQQYQLLNIFSLRPDLDADEFDRRRSTAVRMSSLLSITANNDLVGDGGAIAPSNTIPPGNGNLLGTSAHPLNPLLDTTLRANGAAGGTTTLALLPGSPAIGARRGGRMRRPRCTRCGAPRGEL